MNFTGLHNHSTIQQIFKAVRKTHYNGKHFYNRLPEEIEDIRKLKKMLLKL